MFLLLKNHLKDTVDQIVFQRLNYGEEKYKFHYPGFAVAKWMLTIYLGTVFKKTKKTNTECQLAFEVLDLCQKVSIPVTAEENDDFRQWVAWD